MQFCVVGKIYKRHRITAVLFCVYEPQPAKYYLFVLCAVLVVVVFFFIILLLFLPACSTKWKLWKRVCKAVRFAYRKVTEMASRQPVRPSRARLRARYRSAARTNRWTQRSVFELPRMWIRWHRTWRTVVSHHRSRTMISRNL